MYHKVYCTGGLWTGSDERDKTDITDIKNGLDFITRIRPIQYVRNYRESYIDMDSLSEEEKEKLKKYRVTTGSYDHEAHQRGTKKGQRKKVGVSAQQVQRVLEEMYGTDNHADIVNDDLYNRRLAEDVPDDAESQLSVTYTEFVPFLIAAVQEIVEKYDSEIGKLKERIAYLEGRTE